MQQKDKDIDLQYRDFFEKINIGSVICDPTGKFLHTNQSFSDLIGYTKDELYIMTFKDITHPEDLEEELVILKGMEAQSINDYKIEKRYIRKDKTIIWVELFVSIVRNKKNEPVLLIGTAQNITARKEAEEKLRNSEGRLQLFVQYAPAAIAMFDREMRYIAVSHRFISDYRIKDRKLIGKSHYQVFPEIPSRIKDVHQRCLNGKTERCEEEKFERKDGTVDWVRWEVHPWYQADNEIGGILLFSEVITRRKETEFELIQAKESAEEKEYFLRKSQSAGNIGSYRADFVTETWKSSETLDRIFGINDDFNRTIKGWLSIVHPQDRQMMRDYLVREVMGKKQAFSKEYRIVRVNDKVQRWVLGYGDVSFDKKGNLVEMIGIIMDITERKQIENDLILAKEKAEESDSLKTAFLQNLSHEIRTPLNAIMGFSSLLPQSFNDKQKLFYYSNIINQRGNDLLQIIDDILDIAKIESDQMKVHIEPFNLPDFLTELVTSYNEYKKRIKKENIPLRISKPGYPMHPIIATDRGKLKQILINLINNAYKFTNEGEIELGYRLSNTKELTFYVKDTGIGIPMEKHNHIFQRFVQANLETSNNFGGTGLGLSIVKGLLEILGGDIGITSEPGAGSTFTFTIPVELVVPDRKSGSARDASTPIDQTDFSRLKLLIVEDDEFSLRYLQAILADIACEKHYAKLGKEAIEIALTNPIDVILLDIRLPDITGYEAAKQIKLRKPDIVIIAQTAYASTADREKAFAAGCDDYVSKPINHEILVTQLMKLYNG